MHTHKNTNPTSDNRVVEWYETDISYKTNLLKEWIKTKQEEPTTFFLCSKSDLRDLNETEKNKTLVLPNPPDNNKNFLTELHNKIEAAKAIVMLGGFIIIPCEKNKFTSAIIESHAPINSSSSNFDAYSIFQNYLNELKEAGKQKKLEISSEEQKILINKIIKDYGLRPDALTTQDKTSKKIEADKIIEELKSGKQASESHSTDIDPIKSCKSSSTNTPASSRRNSFTEITKNEEQEQPPENDSTSSIPKTDQEQRKKRTSNALIASCFFSAAAAIACGIGALVAFKKNLNQLYTIIPAAFSASFFLCTVGLCSSKPKSIITQGQLPNNTKERDQKSSTFYL